MKRLVVLLAACVALAACVSAPQRRDLDPVPHPEEWSSDVAGSTDLGDRWWESFGDERLGPLVEQALLHNRDLQAAAARVAQVAGQARIVGADLKPGVNVGADASRGRQVFIGLPIPGAETATTTATTLRLDLAVSWEVDLWGRIRAATRAAIADYQAARLDYDAARLSIAALTGKSWFGVVEARQQLELAREAAQSFGESSDLVRRRYEAGVRPPVDLRLALNRQAEADALVELRRRQLDVATRRLEVIVGRYPAGKITSAEDLPGVPAPIEPGLPGELVARRPDLVAAERRLAAADARLLEARRLLYPRLSLTAAGGTVSTELADLLDGDFRVWSLIGNLTAPLFQGGRLRANVDVARAGTEGAVAVYAQSVLDAYAEVETALAAEEILAAREAALAEAALQSRAAAKLALDRYRSGLDGYLAVLSAQASAVTAESQLLVVKRERLANRIDLHVALGGGFRMDPDWFEDPELKRASKATHNEDGA